MILGPKWRIHYYAHLREIKTGFLNFVSQNKVIGTVGKTGNAKNKPSHLHYSVMSLTPHPWDWDNSKQGWKKLFLLIQRLCCYPNTELRSLKEHTKKHTITKW